MKLRFKIKHLMWLTLWLALLLSVREPLMESIPLLVTAVVAVSAIGAIVLFAGLYWIALAMNEGDPKDSLVATLLCVLLGDMMLFLIFLITESQME